MYIIVDSFAMNRNIMSLRRWWTDTACRDCLLRFCLFVYRSALLQANLQLFDRFLGNYSGWTIAVSCILLSTIAIAIDDFHKLFIDEVKGSKPLFNAAEKSIIIIKFDVDNNTVVILYKKQQKSWH